MKKILSILLAASLLLAMTGCSNKPAEGQTSTEAPAEAPAADVPAASPADAPSGFAGLANPMTVMSEKELLEATGIDLSALSSYEDASFASIAGDPVVAQAQFTKDGKSYTYRVAATDEATDISGMNYVWEAMADEECKVGYCEANVNLSSEGAGLVTWYDMAPGLKYSLSVSENADADELLALANALFAPVQGEADGEFASGTSIENDLTMLLAEIRKNQPIGTAGSSMAALSHSAAFANVVCAYDTNLDELKNIVTAYASKLDMRSLEIFTEQFNIVSGAFTQFSKENVSELLASVGLTLKTDKWDYTLISRQLSECAIAISQFIPLDIPVPVPYQEILDLYLDKLASGGDWEVLEKADLNPLAHYNKDDYSDELGYAVTDIDGDSVMELLIGFTDEKNAMILDLFTLDKEGKAILVFRSAERDSYDFIGNSMFSEHGSSSASDSFDAYYTYSEGSLIRLSSAPKAADPVHIEMMPFAAAESSVG